MWIAAGTLLLTMTVLLHFIESICSQPMTLEDLFPGYKGVMPQAELLLLKKGENSNFEKFGDIPMLYHPGVYVKREHIIFGYLYDENEIFEISHLFNIGFDVHIAFDMNAECWFTLPQDLLKKLGTNRRFQLLVARDQVAGTHVTTSTNSLYKGAHIRAYKEANDRANIVEQNQANLLEGQETTLGESIRAIKEAYSEEYNRVFKIHLEPHGDNEVHGFRRRHP